MSISATSLPARKPTPPLSPQHSGESVKRGERRCEVGGRCALSGCALSGAPSASWKRLAPPMPPSIKELNELGERPRSCGVETVAELGPPGQG